MGNLATDITRLAAYDVAPHNGNTPAIHYGDLLLQIEQAFRTLDPAKHESYWYDIISAAVAGGIKRSALYATVCMAEEIPAD